MTAAAAGGSGVSVPPAVVPPVALGGSGSMAVSPPAASVAGAAPVASPGLSQGALGGAGSAAAASGAGGGGVPGAMSVVPAAVVEDGPARMNAHAQLAADTVRSLIPAASAYPGLAVAAAVVRAGGGVPQVVMSTNEGVGYAPMGFYLPAGLQQAFVELDSADFDLKWAGWVDPARTLVDFVVTSGHMGRRLELLGLASSGVVSEDTKTLFPQVVPRVEPVMGAQPLGLDGGRNRHRLQVLAPTFFDRLRGASERERGRAAAAATRAAMALDVAQPFAGPGSPAMVLLSGHDLSADQWAVLRQEYNDRVLTVGAMRPGFMAGGRNDQVMWRYTTAFRQLRVLETVLCWESLPDVPVDDVVYAAHQAGIDVSVASLLRVP